MNEDWKTRQTLLQRAKDPEDHQAWEEFVHYYRNFILMIMRKMNLSQSEQEDITQEILLKLWKKLESYNQQKAGFRTWLSAVIRNTVLKFYESSGRRLVRENKSFINFLEGDSESELETLIEEEWKSYLTKVALENIRKIFLRQKIRFYSF